MGRASEIEAAAADLPPALAVGTRVRVVARYPRVGHVRTPFYLRGKRGDVVRVLGLFHDPTVLATGGGAPPVRRLYQVAFDYREVWGAGGAEPAGGTRIVADLYDNWLEVLP